MDFERGSTAFLGAFGIALLAVALAFGMHTVVASGDATTGPESPSATASPTVTTTQGSGDIGGTDTTAAQASVQSDLATLGAEMSLYYATWIEGDPQAAIAVAGGSYTLAGTVVSRVSDGVVLTGQYARGPGDWCVGLAPQGALEDAWKYSAASGLTKGNC